MKLTVTSDGFGFEVLKGSEISYHQANKSSCNQNPILHDHRLKCTNRRTTTRKPSGSWGLVTAQYETNSDGFGVLEGFEIFDHQAKNSSCSQNQILHDHRPECTKRRTTTRKPSKSWGIVTGQHETNSDNFGLEVLEGIRLLKFAVYLKKNPKLRVNNNIC